MACPAGCTAAREAPSCTPVPPWHHIVAEEGLRLFFPLAALHAGLWPLLWAVLWHFDLPLAQGLPPVVWHLNEMVFGAWGAALLGFLTTAVPEWTNSPRLRGRALWGLAGLWGLARLIGLTGADRLILPAAVADLAWLSLLTAYLLRVSIRERTTRVLAFSAWVMALLAAACVARYAMWVGAVDLALAALRSAGLVFTGLLGLAMARITVPVSNVILDPLERTSPFRPHPGRLNLAPGLVAIALLAELAIALTGATTAATGFLWIAAGAAFMDRLAEHFIGREFFRAEILALAGSAALTGTGLMLLGAARLGAPWPESAPLHLALMGGLGLGVLAVMSIAGRFHTGRSLGMHRRTRIAFALLATATLLRALPPMAWLPWPPGPLHLWAALAWSAGFLLWLHDYWPLLSRPAHATALRPQNHGLRTDRYADDHPER